MNSPASVPSDGDQPFVDEPAEHMPGFPVPGLQFAQPDRGAGRRGVIRDVDEP